jgi:hypothetical protein
MVASAGGDLALWQFNLGQKVRDLGAPGDETRSVRPVAFLPGGKTLFSKEFHRRRGDGLSLVRYWETDSGRQLRSLPINSARRDYDDTFALSPDGKTLAGKCNEFRDIQIQLWDMVSGKSVARLGGHAGGAITTLAFSPDSKILASGGRDTSVLLWDVTRDRLEHLWSELTGGSDEAGRAIKKRAATPQKAIPFLEELLRQAVELEVQVEGMIASLDSDEFAVREKASRGLERLGPEARIALRLVLERSTSQEVQTRLQAILEKMKQDKAASPCIEPHTLWLSLAVLEEICSPEARRALQGLAKGPAASAVALEARVALNRLATQHKTP